MSNLSEPLIGVVDTAILGQLASAHYIGAIAVGGIIFNFLFWSFGFLRMGTSGMTAQASGAQDNQELRAVLGRALLIAGVCGSAMVLLAPLISILAFWLVEGSAEVEQPCPNLFQHTHLERTGSACQLCLSRLVHRHGAGDISRSCCKFC